MECQANFQKLQQTNQRGNLHGAGSRSRRVRPEGNAARSHQPLTRNFLVRLPRGTALCLLLFSQALLTLASCFAGQLDSERIESQPAPAPPGRCECRSRAVHRFISQEVTARRPPPPALGAPHAEASKPAFPLQASSWMLKAGLLQRGCLQRWVS